MLKNFRGLFSRPLNRSGHRQYVNLHSRRRNRSGRALRRRAAPAGNQHQRRSSRVDAKRMLGRTPKYHSDTAIKDGVIADFLVTEKMLTYFIAKVHENSLFDPVLGADLVHANHRKLSDALSAKARSLPVLAMCD